MASTVSLQNRAVAAPGVHRDLSSLRHPTSSLFLCPSLQHSSAQCRPRQQLQVRARIPEEGMYGGPPDRRFRKTWGGEKRKDPLETGDYLWDNKEDWKRVLDKELKEASSPPSSSRERGSSAGAENEGSGFLSLGRSMALDSLDVDLSRELIPTRTVSLEDQVEAARIAAGERLLGRAPPSQASGEGATEGEAGIKWRAVNTPSSRESRQRDKGQSYSFKPGGYFKEVKPETQEEEEARFQELKDRLCSYTVGLGIVFSASAALTYSPEIATSFALGTVGSIVYVRMLTTSVEALGRSGLGNAARGSMGQPRLLVPVVLVMTYNRWNAILAPEYGLAELQLIPMLLGFLTYKAATIVQTFQDILVVPEPPSAESSEGPSSST